MRLSVRYGSHLLVLMQAVGRTYGPVLELGIGVFSTPILHSLCTLEKRELLSVDNDPVFGNAATSEYHKVMVVANWAAAPIDRSWDVALIDHSPSERRVEEIRRLAGLAQYLVVHDTNWNLERYYHYKAIWPLFKYRLDFGAVYPSTTVLSNFRPLDKFWERTWPRTVTW